MIRPYATSPNYKITQQVSFQNFLTHVICLAHSTPQLFKPAEFFNKLDVCRRRRSTVLLILQASSTNEPWCQVCLTIEQVERDLADQEKKIHRAQKTCSNLAKEMREKVSITKSCLCPIFYPDTYLLILNLFTLILDTFLLFST